ncbi:hypothetical protein B0H14DRAFT_2989789 [Mycena olivaceomarginata]|nr:hypothetical protein B0H14DRAFT_2989789 [Mycena olivaceomarginata]
MAFSPSFMPRYSQRTATVFLLSLALLSLFLWQSSTTLKHTAPAPLTDDVSVAAGNVEIMAPTVYPDHKYAWINENQKTSHALFRCIARGDLVLIASHYFMYPLQGGYIGGEAIWALSTMRALHNMGYSVLYARSIDTALHLYHIYANLVQMVITNAEDLEESQSPLGSKWTLSPENYSKLTSTSYLGYSIEAQCSRYSFIPHSERKRQVYILAKFLKYFAPEERAWPPDFFDAAANATGISFVMAAVDPPEDPKLKPGDLAASIENIGRRDGELFTQDRFYQILSHSVALVGVGNPLISPTPYDALCLGIPFVNPVHSWDTNNPTDRTRWATQHDALKDLSAPYVYNVFLGDRDGFVNAIKSAAENPIESYVLERMKIGSVEYRLGKILEHDWKTEAAKLLKAREAGQVPGELFEL